MEIPNEHEFITLDEIMVLAHLNIPEDNHMLLREQAACCMLFLSAMRSNAFGSLPIRAVDLKNMAIHQWPKWGVRTKNGKHATTYLLNIPELLKPVFRWDEFVQSNLPPNAMWYTPFDTNTFGSKRVLSPAPAGKNRKTAVARGIRKLFNLTDLPYKSPHKFRHGHAVHALLGAKTMANYKAISQNLMHSNIKVTDEIYAWLNNDEIKDHISGLSVGKSQSIQPENEFNAYLGRLSKDKLKMAINYAADLLAHS
jgi:integrase